MARSWKQERTTPKTTPVKPARPRMSDFAKELYQGKGYQVDPYCDEPDDNYGPIHKPYSS